MSLWLPEGLPRVQQVDAEEACQNAVKAWERRTETRLTQEDREDALQELRLDAWRVSQRFDASRGIHFRNFLFSSLYHRTTDWLRADEGRTVWKFANSTYIRERHTTISLDATRTDDDGDSRPLLELVGVRNLGPDSDSPAELLERLYRQGNSSRARGIRALRQGLQEEIQSHAA